MIFIASGTITQNQPLLSQKNDLSKMQFSVGMQLMVWPALTALKKRGFEESLFQSVLIVAKIQIQLPQFHLPQDLISDPLQISFMSMTFMPMTFFSLPSYLNWKISLRMGNSYAIIYMQSVTLQTKAAAQNMLQTE